MATFNLDEFNVEWNHYGRPQKIRGDIILPKAASIESAIFEFLSYLQIYWYLNQAQYKKNAFTRPTNEKLLY